MTKKNTKKMNKSTTRR